MAMFVELNTVNMQCKTGLFAWERKLCVTLQFHIRIQLQTEANSLAQTVDYTQIHALLVHYASIEFELIEQLANAICAQIFEQFSSAHSVQIRINKPHLPIPKNNGASSCIELFRQRKDI